MKGFYYYFAKNGSAGILANTAPPPQCLKHCTANYLLLILTPKKMPKTKQPKKVLKFYKLKQPIMDKKTTVAEEAAKQPTVTDAEKTAMATAIKKQYDAFIRKCKREETFNLIAGKFISNFPIILLLVLFYFIGGLETLIAGLIGIGVAALIIFCIKYGVELECDAKRHLRGLNEASKHGDELAKDILDSAVIIKKEK